MSLPEIEIDLGTATMQCTAPEIAEIFSGLLREMRRMIPRLRSDELEVLRQIMQQESGTVTVGQLFPDFSRESEPHATLRRLRAAQFIRPARSGRWDPEEPIEVKPFARLVWDRLGEEGLFPNQREVPNDPTPQPAVSWDDNILDLGDPAVTEFP